MKKLPAIIAAFTVTGLVALAMLLVGANAFFNPNGVAAASDPGSAQQIAVTGGDAQTIAQLQARIQEYQAREKQYQQQLDQARTQLEQANTDLTQYQQLISSLQDMGVLRIDNSGNVSIGRFGRHDD
jgi:TolA-binding protein